MTRGGLAVVLAAFVVLGVDGARATDVRPGQEIAAGDPIAGKEKSQANVCQECHTADGNSTPPEYPKLAGQHVGYLHKQLRDFQSGQRKHQVMNAMADSIPDEDLADIAAYFSTTPVMRGAARVESPVGKALFLNGDAARDVPACAGCHGADGKGLHGSDSAGPVIGGQHRFYLRAQLLDWRGGVRTNSESGVMNSVTRQLTATEIEALAEYLAGL
ncbi:MAG: c-type cytochrome [Azoarcus sp.]|nr:c-type cytochrome [Azoarcus sp.]